MNQAVIVESSGSQIKLLGSVQMYQRSKLADDGDFSATPAPVEGGLLLRSSKALHLVGAVK